MTYEMRCGEGNGATGFQYGMRSAWQEIGIRGLTEGLRSGYLVGWWIANVAREVMRRKHAVQDAPLPWRYRSVFAGESPSGIEAKQWALGGLWQ